MFSFDIPLPPKAAIEYMVESRYGFALVDVDISKEDLDDFEKIQIISDQDYSRCFEEERIESEIAIFLSNIGNSDSEVVNRVASRIQQIADQILNASAKDSIWLWLRAKASVNVSKQLNWHLDWSFYQGKGIQYRFVMTLKGPSTLFYPLSTENIALREKIWRREDRYFFAKYCCADEIFIPGPNLGVVFLNKQGGALHSEPLDMDGGRLFLSIVPCNKEEMAHLKPRVEEYFSRLEKNRSAF
jgi:hypothetical protein